jgi:hypothetical protein
VVTNIKVTVLLAGVAICLLVVLIVFGIKSYRAKMAAQAKQLLLKQEAVASIAVAGRMEAMAAIAADAGTPERRLAVLVESELTARMKEEGLGTPGYASAEAAVQQTVDTVVVAETALAKAKVVEAQASDAAYAAQRAASEADSDADVAAYAVKMDAEEVKAGVAGAESDAKTDEKMKTDAEKYAKVAEADLAAKADAKAKATVAMKQALDTADAAEQAAEQAWQALITASTPDLSGVVEQQAWQSVVGKQAAGLMRDMAAKYK